MLRENLQRSADPNLSGTQSIDYTTVPAGLCIKGQLWTGQATTFTERCPKCGRIGVVSAAQNDKRIMVHRGRVIMDMLEGIDYCEFDDFHAVPRAPGSSQKEPGRLMSHATSLLRSVFTRSWLR